MIDRRRFPTTTAAGTAEMALGTDASASGAREGEPTLLRIAYAYEQATNERRAPTFAATLG